jgi:hypothetical protein
MFDPAHVGVHRLTPKVVIPEALDRPQVSHWVPRISLFASAQDRTTSPGGRSSVFPSHPNSLGADGAAAAAAATNNTSSPATLTWISLLMANLLVRTTTSTS